MFHVVCHRASFLCHWSALRIAVLLVSLAVLGASAQTADSEYTPRRGQAGKDVMWLPTPDDMVDSMLRMAEVTPQDLLVDLGSGDGKIAIAAARQYGARALGLEFNPELVEVSRRRGREAGVMDKVEFRQADIFVADFSNASVVTMYLLPELNLRLRPVLFRMKPGTRVSSHSFDMGSWRPDETTYIGTGRTFLWVVPAAVAGSWRLSYSAAFNEAPSEVVLRQRFQSVDGEAGLARWRASLRDVRLRGASIAFEVRDGRGRPLQFSGQVAGDRMTGDVVSGHAGQMRFTAVRTSAGQSFGEAEATAQEQADAVRALGNP